MIRLKINIFCKEVAYEDALNDAHLARRPLEEVFKPQAFEHCTISGRPPHA